MTKFPSRQMLTALLAGTLIGGTLLAAPVFAAEELVWEGAWS